LRFFTARQLQRRRRSQSFRVANETRRLSSVAENLMLLSRADTGRLALRATEFDLRKLLDGSLEDVRILGAGNNLQIETNVPETLPMKGDQEMISLTVQNLVENAVKYNRRGGKILVSAERHDHVVQICVGNSGPGIPPERAPHVFERFYRARGDERTPGHGLGLSIAREMARAHGGGLTLTRAQSDWTEFCLRLSASSLHVQTQKPPPVGQE